MAGLKTDIQRQIESKLVQIEFQAAIQVPNINIDRVDAEVRIFRSRRTSG